MGLGMISNLLDHGMGFFWQCLGGCFIHTHRDVATVALQSLGIDHRREIIPHAFQGAAFAFEASHEGTHVVGEVMVCGFEE